MVRPRDAEPARPRRTATRRRRPRGDRAPQWGQTTADGLMKPSQPEHPTSSSMPTIVDVGRAKAQFKTMAVRRLEVTQDTPLHPAYVVWELTLACDQPCTHCGSRAGDARPTELSTEAALKVVDQLAAAGAREVVLIGGEAY